MAIEENCKVENINIKDLQQILMADDWYIPWHKRNVSPLTLSAKCTHEIVRNGLERGEDNLWIGNQGDYIEYEFENDTHINNIRLVFDSNLNRNYHNMPCNYPIVQEKFKLPDTLITEYIIEGESENGKKQKILINNNHQRFVVHNVNWNVKKIRFVPISTNGCEKFRCLILK